MSRTHRDFIDLDAVEETPLHDGPFAGAVRRLLSRDEETGAETTVLTCPAGWSADVGALAGSLELLSLSGTVRIDGTVVPVEGWARVPNAAALRELTTPDGAAELIVMSDPTDSSEGETAIVDVREMAWRQGIRGGPGGIGVKTLHEGQTVSLVIANVPRYLSGPEFHDCPEELFVLAGDVTGRAGEMRRGSYFWRPEYITHGPYWSEGGLHTFVRGHGDIVAHWIEDADATVDQNREYLERLTVEKTA